MLKYARDPGPPLNESVYAVSALGRAAGPGAAAPAAD
jgi:hypothetical protein